MIPLSDDNPRTLFPIVTLCLIGLCILIFFWQVSVNDTAGVAVILSFGLIPARLFGGAGVPSDVAQGHQESRLNQKMHNRSGTVGIMQIRPSTAREKEIAILFGAGLIAALMTGCAALDESIDDRYGSIDRSTGKARNESVLRNIARASQRIPLSFMAFSKVTGGLASSVSGGLPNFAVGPQPVPTQIQRVFLFGNTTLSGSAGMSNAVDFTVLESSDFYRALLDPSDLIDFHTLVQQGYPRELLFWLFADSVRIKITDRSNPRSPRVEFWEIMNSTEQQERCKYIVGIGPGPLCFKDMVEFAMFTGLSVQVKSEGGTERRPRGRDRRDRGDTERQERHKIYSRLCRDNFFEKQTERFVIESRRDYLPSQALRKLLAAAKVTPSCAAEFRPKSDDPPKLDLRSVAGSMTYDYEIRPRSTFAIYQFLGRILAANAMNEMLMTGLERETVQNPQILSVVVGQSADCAVTTPLRGTTYCVPEQGSEMTKLTFNLLNQLIALKTHSKDLGITPTVRLSPSF